MKIIIALALVAGKSTNEILLFMPQRVKIMIAVIYKKRKKRFKKKNF